MSEPVTKEQLLSDYKDLILSLKDNSKTKQKGFQKAWNVKWKKVFHASFALEEDDWNWLDAEYQKFYKEHIKPD